MNNRGELVLRDVVFMMMMVSSIFVLAGFFVTEMAINYENTNMSNEWSASGTNTLANSTFFDTGNEVAETGTELGDTSTGLYSLISSAVNALDGIGGALFMVLKAPNVIGDLVGATLQDAGVNSTVAIIIKYLIIVIFWTIIIFTIVSAFLRGGKL